VNTSCGIDLCKETAGELDIAAEKSVAWIDRVEQALGHEQI